jgi:hypothetical protein
MAQKKLDRSVNHDGPGTSLRAAPIAHSNPDILHTAQSPGALLQIGHSSLVHFAAPVAALEARSAHLDSAPVSDFVTDIYLSHVELEFSRYTGAFHQRFTS